MGALLSRDETIDGLRELTERARHAGITGAHIHIVGGSALRLAYFDRAATPDIDAQISHEEQLRPHVEQIARERGWPSDWLNSNAAQFIPHWGRKVDWEPLHDSEIISVWVAPASALLAMKLRAMEGRRGRDESDVAHLLAVCGIADVDEAEEVLGSYFPGDAFSDRVAEAVKAMFDHGLPVITEAPTDPFSEAS